MNASDEIGQRDVGGFSNLSVGHLLRERGFAQRFEIWHLQCVAGTAPVSYQSGQIHKVYLRRHCNKFLRHTVHLWADLSRARSPWAQTYYQQQRSRGKSHACAIRALGQRWLKILWKMWLSNSTYNPDFHTKNQLEHGSWVLKLLTQSPNA